MVEPRFLRPEMAMTISGAKETFFVPAREIEGYPGVEAYSRKEFEKLRISWDAFYEKAAKAAAKWLATIEPKIVRDEAGRPKYAVIHSERPLVSGLIVANNFVEKFQPVFGERLIVYAPDRNNLFVFPENFEIYSQYGMAMRKRFDDATYASSREIFLWRAGEKAPKAVGTLGN